VAMLLNLVEYQSTAWYDASHANTTRAT